MSRNFLERMEQRLLLVVVVLWLASTSSSLLFASCSTDSSDVHIRKYRSSRIPTVSNNIKTGRVKNGDGDQLEREKHDRHDLPVEMNDYKRDNNNNNNTARVVTNNYNDNNTIYNNRNNNKNNNDDDINNNNNSNKNDNYNNNNNNYNYNYNNNNSKINNYINNGMNNKNNRFMKSLNNIVNNGTLNNFNDNPQGSFDTWEEKRHRRRHHPRFISQSIFIEDEKRRHSLKRNIYDSYRNQFDDLTKMHRNKPIKNSNNNNNNNNKNNNNNRLERLQNKPNNSLTNDDIDTKKNEPTNSRRKIRQTENDLTAKPFRHQVTCPKNLGLVSGQICGKSCKRDVDCRGNKRKCLCDGPCGMTCVKTTMRCKKLEPLANGYFETEPILGFDSKALYACDDGFILSGRKERRCQADGTWSDKPPKCLSEGACGQPPFVLHATFNDPKPSQSSSLLSVSSSSFPFFSPTLSSSSSSSSSSSLNAPYDYSTPNIITNYDEEVTYELGTQLWYQCERGYRRVGLDRTICAGEGRWTILKMKCLPIECSTPGKVLNSKLMLKSYHHHHPNHNLQRPVKSSDYLDDKSEETYFYRDKIVYGCLNGYYLKGNKERECTADGSWSGREPSCIAVNCLKPRSIENGVLKVSSRNANTRKPHKHNKQQHHVITDDKYEAYGSLVTYICNEGHVIEGDDTRMCLEDGEWSGLEPTCKVVHCQPIPKSYNLLVSTYDTVYNTIVTFSCIRDSTILTETVSATCNANGSWSIQPPICYSRCKIPPPIGGSLEDMFVVGSYVDHGFNLTLKCDQGMVMEGEGILCYNGTWMSTVGCVKSTNSCDEVRPPELKDGYFKYHGTQHGETAKYFCYSGYRLEGPDTVTCYDGVWLGDMENTTCVLKLCEYPGTLENGDILLIGIKGQFTYRNYVKKVKQYDQIEYRCRKDFTLEGPEGSTCVDGVWSPKTIPTCQPRRHLQPAFERYRRYINRQAHHSNNNYNKLSQSNNRKKK